MPKRNSLEFYLLSSVEGINSIFSCPAHPSSSCPEPASPEPAAAAAELPRARLPRHPALGSDAGATALGSASLWLCPSPTNGLLPSPLAPLILTPAPSGTPGPRAVGCGSLAAGAGAQHPGPHTRPAGRQDGARPTPAAALCSPRGPPAAEKKPSSWSLLPRSGCCGELSGNPASGVG